MEDFPETEKRVFDSKINLFQEMFRKAQTDHTFFR